MRKFIFFINPISGTSNKEKLLEFIHSEMKKTGIGYEVMHTTKDGDYPFLRKKIAAENITDIIVCGGDGTINQVVHALENEQVNIGIIPMGSGNGLALAAGISKNKKKALEVILKGKASHVDGFLINGKFSCMLSGLGFDAQVAHDFAIQKTRGLATYMQQTWINFQKAKPYRFRIILENERILLDAFFISIANSNQFGNHVTIAPKASLSDGLIDIVIAKKMSKAMLLYKVGRQLLFGAPANDFSDEKIKKGQILYYQTKKLRIENLQMAPLHIDGDPMPTANAFEIAVMPRAFLLLKP